MTAQPPMILFVRPDPIVEVLVPLIWVSISRCDVEFSVPVVLVALFW